MGFEPIKVDQRASVQIVRADSGKKGEPSPAQDRQNDQQSRD